jgi:DNA invertase Pin-like site-specific DNA recombinase
MNNGQSVKYCAVYTRKSSEEGLEQGFNSLDAQREACLAYVASQKSEAWKAVKTTYDDGGFSGGTLDRPGLQALLSDIRAGRVNIIVVYKIDRLTRSLMDFAKLVELFDQHRVTFVSVTQSFNTTTSMGRLTLNILLSFAQFERELTGERIRDKIAASKKKGIWMGGAIPFGYELKNRCLLVLEREARIVREMFPTYLRLGSVLKLKEVLDRKGYKTRRGFAFSRGMLYGILSNPLYIGKLKHKGQVHDGAHQAVVTQEIWAEVQQKLAEQSAVPRGRRGTSQTNLLRGVLYDQQGHVYSPVFTTKRGLRYRYYVSRVRIEQESVRSMANTRIPAQEIETFVEKALRDKIQDPKVFAEMFSINDDIDCDLVSEITEKIAGTSTASLITPEVCRVTVGRERLDLRINLLALKALVEREWGLSLLGEPGRETFEFTAPFQVSRTWMMAKVIKPPEKDTAKDMFDLPPYELKNLVRGVIWRDQHFGGMTIREIAKRDGRSDAFVGRLIRNTFELA